MSNKVDLVRAPVARNVVDANFRPMASWDERDDPVLLLIDYREDGEFALGDAHLSVTIGHNSDHNVTQHEAQGWQFAGWDNSHECYTQGKGLPIGWMPLPSASFEIPWRWWAGRNEDEYTLAGPCLTREAAISEAYGDTEPGDTIYIVEAREGEREPGLEGELIDFAETRNYSCEVRKDDRAQDTFMAGERAGIEAAAKVAESHFSGANATGRAIAVSIRALANASEWLPGDDADRLQAAWDSIGSLPPIIFTDDEARAILSASPKVASEATAIVSYQPQTPEPVLDPRPGPSTQYAG